MSATSFEIPNYSPGSWRIAPERSKLSFCVRHLNLHNVRGTVDLSGGEVVVGAEPTDSSVTATIDLRTVDTRIKARDRAISGPELLDVENNPTATYRSTGMAPDPDGGGADFLVEGELTFLGRTGNLPLRLRFERFEAGVDGRISPVFTARAQLIRRDFGFLFQVRPAFLDRAIAPAITFELLDMSVATGGTRSAGIAIDSVVIHRDYQPSSSLFSAIDAYAARQVGSSRAASLRSTSARPRACTIAARSSARQARSTSTQLA